MYFMTKWKKKRRPSNMVKKRREKDGRERDQQGSKSVKRALSTKIHRVYFKWVSIFYFKFDPILIFKKIPWQNKRKRRPSYMVKKRRKKERGERKRESVINMGQIVYNELYQPKKYIECIFKWDHYFLFPIWSHINLKRSNQDGHEKRRPFNMVKKEEKERRMTNKGQIVLRELYQPKKHRVYF